jgi:hypothetical protein
MSLQRRARDLIAEAGDGDGPTPAERARLRARVLARVGAAAAIGTATAGAALSVKGGPGVATGSGATSVAKSSLGALVMKLISVVAIVGIGATGYFALSGARDTRTPSAGARAPASLAAPSLAASKDVAPVPRASAAAAAIAPDESPQAAPRAETPKAVTSGATSPEAHPVVAPGNATRRGEPTTRGETAASTESVEAETAALAGVLASLREGHAEQAMAQLDDQDSRYRAGVLAEERGATRIDALCALGRTEAARAAVTRFLQLHPRSLLAPRVAASCGAPPPP